VKGNNRPRADIPYGSVRVLPWRKYIPQGGLNVMLGLVVPVEVEAA